MKCLDLVVGTRPNIVKLAPVLRALRRTGRFEVRVVHTGQHTGNAMIEDIRSDLGLSAPEVVLDAGDGCRDEASIRRCYTQHLGGRDRLPDGVVVFGDVTSTVAAAGAASELSIPVAHVEAGLRCFDPEMVEEDNRVRTDRLSGLRLASEPSGITNLRRERLGGRGAILVGNVMADSLRLLLPRARERVERKRLGLRSGGYALCTAHRARNVDDPARLRALVDLIVLTSRRLPVVLLVHPRTHDRLVVSGLDARLREIDDVLLEPPLGYLATLSLLHDAAVALTDSGGLSEEAAMLGVPCLTLRPFTERPSTVELGTNRVVDLNRTRALEQIASVRRQAPHRRPEVPFWDGHAGERVVAALTNWLA